MCGRLLPPLLLPPHLLSWQTQRQHLGDDNGGKTAIIRGYASFVSDNTYNPELPITPYNLTSICICTRFLTQFCLPIPCLWGVVMYLYNQINRQPQLSTIQYHPRQWRPRPDVQSAPILHLQKTPGQFWPSFFIKTPNSTSVRIAGESLCSCRTELYFFSLRTQGDNVLP